MDHRDHDAHAQMPHGRADVGGHGAMASDDVHAGHGAGHAPSGGTDHDAHATHAGHDPAAFRDRFWLSLLLSVPILIWSEMIQEWLGFNAPEFALSDRVPFLFGTIVFVYGGRPFLIGAYREYRRRQPGMMLLITLAISVAFLASLASETGSFSLEFWWELALLIDVMLLGHWQEMRALGQASGALEALAALLPDEAEIVDGAQTRRALVSELSVGDLVLVRPGGRVPADGVIETGTSGFDESMITGESRDVTHEPGDRIVAGTVATDGSVRVRIDAVGDETTLAGIRRLVEQARSARSRTQALADRAAAGLFFVAVVAGVLTMLVWSAVGSPSQGVVRAVTVLVIACPHALGLAIPLVIALSTAISARAGILVKDRLALEDMRRVDVVLFDKTGTLTLGEPVVHDVAAIDGAEDDLLRLAAAAEVESEHPIGRAIVGAARERGGVPTPADVRSTPGRGVAATVDGSTVAVGGPAMLRDLGLDEPDELADRIEKWRERGATILTVVRDGRPAGAIAVEDRIRPSSREAVRQLHAEGIRVAMVTGDARSVAEHVAEELGIDEVSAEVLPQEKDSVVASLQARGLRVAMVGDGVNDAPALARADVGIAIGAGTDVAAESAGVILASDDPRAVVAVRRLSDAGYRKMVQNLVWATGYNVVAIPLAAGALAWAGIVLPPAVGALLMSLSTIVVALNAQLLRRVDLGSTG